MTRGNRNSLAGDRTGDFKTKALHERYVFRRFVTE